MSQIVVLAGIAVCAVLGYRIIAAIPPLLHTPLMSGMNALSGITLLVALAALRIEGVAAPLAWTAIALASMNVVGGFWVTERMLGMFRKDRSGKGGGAVGDSLS